MTNLSHLVDRALVERPLVLSMRLNGAQQRSSIVTPTKAIKSANKKGLAQTNPFISSVQNASSSCRGQAQEQGPHGCHYVPARSQYPALRAVPQYAPRGCILS